MFFPSHLFHKSTLSSEEIRCKLASPRIEYGDALMGWYQENSKLGDYLNHARETNTYNHRITEQKIVNCLRQGPMETHDIARRIVGRSTSRRPIISVLHKMASDGIIIHHQVNNKHIWELTRSSQIDPIIVPPIPA